MFSPSKYKFLAPPLTATSPPTHETQPHSSTSLSSPNQSLATISIFDRHVLQSSPPSSFIETEWRTRRQSNFEKIISSNGLVSICGFGSLLSNTIDQIALSSWSSLSHFVFWTLIVLSIFLWRTREKLEEYVSRFDQLQSCETQQFLAKQRVDEGEKKKMRRKTEERREAGERKRKKEKICFKWKRREKFYKFFFLTLSYSAHLWKMREKFNKIFFF